MATRATQLLEFFQGDHLSVKMFAGGASIWDGVTDALPAFAAAIAYCSVHGKALYVPSGQYFMSAGVQLGPGFLITTGSGAGSGVTWTATITIGVHTISVGDIVYVRNSLSTGYNASAVPITAKTSTTVSYSLSHDPGTWLAGSVGSVTTRWDQNIRIIGEGREHPIITASFTGAIFTLGLFDAQHAPYDGAAQGFQLKHLTLRDPLRDSFTEPFGNRHTIGVQANGSGTVWIEDCYFNGLDYGIANPYGMDFSKLIDNTYQCCNVGAFLGYGSQQHTISGQDCFVCNEGLVFDSVDQGSVCSTHGVDNNTSDMTFEYMVPNRLGYGSLAGPSPNQFPQASDLTQVIRDTWLETGAGYVVPAFDETRRFLIQSNVAGAGYPRNLIFDGVRAEMGSTNIAAKIGGTVYSIFECTSGKFIEIRNVVVGGSRHDCVFNANGCFGEVLVRGYKAKDGYPLRPLYNIIGSSATFQHYTYEDTFQRVPKMLVAPDATNTTVAAAIGTGSVTVTPLSMGTIATGTRLMVENHDQTNAEQVVVSSTTSTTFTATFVLPKSTSSGLILISYYPLSTPAFAEGMIYPGDTVIVAGGAREYRPRFKNAANVSHPLAYADDMLNGTRGTGVPRVNVSTVDDSIIIDTTFTADGTALEIRNKPVAGALILSTTIAASIAVGTQTVTPASMVGVTQGMKLRCFNSDLSNQETIHLSAVTSTTFTALFASTKTGPGIVVTALDSGVSKIQVRNKTFNELAQYIAGVDGGVGGSGGGSNTGGVGTPQFVIDPAATIFSPFRNASKAKFNVFEGFAVPFSDLQSFVGNGLLVYVSDGKNVGGIVAGGGAGVWAWPSGGVWHCVGDLGSLGSIPTTALTGVLQAAQFPALTGGVTTVAGALATTLHIAPADLPGYAAITPVTNRGTAITTTTLLAVTATGMYRVNYYVSVHTTGTASATPVIRWTDRNGNAQAYQNFGPALGSVNNFSAGPPWPIQCLTGTNITYEVGLSAGTGTFDFDGSVMKVS